jgi:hypothetical protein
VLVGFVVGDGAVLVGFVVGDGAMLVGIVVDGGAVLVEPDRSVVGVRGATDDSPDPHAAAPRHTPRRVTRHQRISASSTIDDRAVRHGTIRGDRPSGSTAAPDPGHAPRPGTRWLSRH